MGIFSDFYFPLCLTASVADRRHTSPQVDTQRGRLPAARCAAIDWTVELRRFGDAVFSFSDWT